MASRARDGQLRFSAVSKHVKLMFFRGTSLKPVPPSGEHKDGRALDLTEEDVLDEKEVASWVQQAAPIMGGARELRGARSSGRRPGTSQRAKRSERPRYCLSPVLLGGRPQQY